MLELLRSYEQKSPEIVFKWNDPETDAQGWLVINSLRGGAAGGGTRMHANVTQQEVESLAKTMELKFSVSGPNIGGAKSGINFDPKDPRKKDVLRRWYTAIKPVLQNYYGTAGDLNVDAVEDVIPITRDIGLSNPAEGMIRGYLKLDDAKTHQIMAQLQKGVTLPLQDASLKPVKTNNLTVADMVTGYGVSESARHYYDLYAESIKGKRAIIQGWGNVGASTAYYMAQAGVRIVGITAINGGLLKPEGLSFEEVSSLFAEKEGNELRGEGLVAFDKVNELVWDLGADIFVPAAASRLVTQEQIQRMVKAGLELITCGANVPFADESIFWGPVGMFADKTVGVIPDFIANCGFARTFGYFMREKAEVKDTAIFADVSNTIASALQQAQGVHSGKTNIMQGAFQIALERLM